MERISFNRGHCDLHCSVAGALEPETLQYARRGALTADHRDRESRLCQSIATQGKRLTETEVHKIDTLNDRD